MYDCEICGEEVSKIYVCKECGTLFCAECGSPSEKLCILCTAEEEDEEYDEEEWKNVKEEEDEEYNP